MAIRKQFNPVEIGTWNGDMISFEFRTYLESATLLSSNDEVITVTVLERTFYLQINKEINLALIPQLRFAFVPRIYLSLKTFHSLTVLISNDKN